MNVDVKVTSDLAGVRIPDSKLAREITELVRDTETPLLFHHSSRVYYWGALAGKRQGFKYDPELLYAGAMFHDMGLTHKHSSAEERFEVDGANAARDFLRSHGIAQRDIDTVWTAIALHTTPGIPQHMHPVVALVTAGVEMDVLGLSYNEYSDAERETVVRAHPRSAHFKEDIIRAFYNGIKHKPETTFGNVKADVLADKDPHFSRGNFCSVIRASAWRGQGAPSPSIEKIAQSAAARKVSHVHKPIMSNAQEPTMSKTERFTNATGAPVADNTNIMTAGPRGPALLQDIWLIEKLAHFDREVIPERRMHAKGWGAHGTFTVTHDISRYTKARIFSQVGKQTPMFARFSTVAGERGAADAERDIRGTAIKFYTEDGNWDIVGNNTPVFFFRDPLRFSDLNHAIKRDPRTGLRSADNNWDFWSLLPEALHQVTIVMSDRGIPKSFRHMHLFGSHTFSMINAANERVWVKFHFRSQQGIQNLSDAEAEALVAKDRESHGRDLLNAIESGDFPRWTLFIQVMTEAQAKTHRLNPFDLTKVWPKAEYPLIEVGVMELNRYPDNYFAEVEQAAFSPANIVPGIGFSPDKMLQGRLFSYGDTQRYRLGVNFNHIPVNAPKCPFQSYHRDGKMRTDGNLGGTLTFHPNSAGLWDNQPDFAEPPMPIEGDAAHWDHRLDDDHWEQPGNLFRKMTPQQKKVLFENTARALGDARAHIKQRHVDNCTRADPAYGAGVAKALGLKQPELVD